jgi:ribose 5-phosphate isomerase RpiB
LYRGFTRAAFVACKDPAVVVGMVLAKEKFFGYMCAVEANEYCANSLRREVTAAVECLGCEEIQP